MQHPDFCVSAAMDDAKQISLWETLYHTANGYLGVRNAPEEGDVPCSIRGTYLNGFYEEMDIHYGEKLYGFPDTKQTLVNVPDAQTVRVFLDGRQFSLFSDVVSHRQQELDMEAGETRRTALWHTKRGEVAVCVRRMASFAMPNVFVMRLTLTSNGYEGPVRLVSGLNGNVTNYAADDDPRVAAKPLKCLRELRRQQTDEHACLFMETLRSRLQLCCAVTHECELSCVWHETVGGYEATFEGVLGPQQPLEFVKYVVYTDSRRCEDCTEQAVNLLSRAQALGANKLAAAQRDLLGEWWKKALVRLEAPAPLSQALTYDLYQLFQSTGTDGVGSVAAKGLSGEGYEGHIFWDSEIYVLPFFLWTRPEVARALLSCRFHMLDQARKNARILGLQKGALFPWRTISGSECSPYFPSGTAQYHINGDIAYAFLQYWLVTGDYAFMAQEGAQVLVETARTWLELGHMDGGAFHLHCVTGPDEYTCLVNDNFYTNAAAQYHLRGTARLVRELVQTGLDAAVRATTGVTDAELEAFERVADAMYLPTDPNLGISPQDDSFLQKKRLDFKSLPATDFPLLLHYHPLFLYRHQVCKQADTVLAHLLFPESADADTIRRSYAYYQQVTTHDSSLSICIFAIMAARLGLAEAEKGFAQTALLDLHDTHGNTRDGLHTASLGGAYLAMLRGFAGIRADAAGLTAAPCLPVQWTSYEVPFSFRGRSLRCTVDHVRGAELHLETGETLQLQWYGQTRVVSANHPLTHPLA